MRNSLSTNMNETKFLLLRSPQCNGNCIEIKKPHSHWRINWIKEFPLPPCVSWGRRSWQATVGSGEWGAGLWAEATSGDGVRRVGGVSVCATPHGLFSIENRDAQNSGLCLRSRGILSSVENSSNFLITFKIYFISLIVQTMTVLTVKKWAK